MGTPSRCLRILPPLVVYAMETEKLIISRNSSKDHPVPAWSQPAVVRVGGWEPGRALLASNCWASAMACITLATRVAWSKLVYMVVKSKVWRPVEAIWMAWVRTNRAYSPTLSKTQKHRRPVSR
jgi:hypothetical protein